MPKTQNKIDRHCHPPLPFSPQISHGLATLNTRIKKLKFNELSITSQYINHTPPQYHFIQTQNSNNQSIIQDQEKFSVQANKKLTEMISARKLIKIARKWQKVAALRRKRISFPEKIDEAGTSDHSSEVAEKGHFIIYTTDRVRFSYAIAYLSSLIFRELLRMSEEEFGLRGGEGALPCDSQFLSCISSLVQKKADRDVEKALLLSMAAYRCSSSYNLHQRQQTSQHILLFGC